MANLVSKATGNFLTGASWYEVETGTRAVQAAHSASTNTTGSTVYAADALDATGTVGHNCVGLLMFCKRVNTTGTVKVVLSADSGVTETVALTVNASDLPLRASWVFFVFGTPLALDGGTDYAVGIQGSSAGNATFYRDGSTANWTKLIVWDSSPANPAAADVLYIVGNQTGAGTENAVVITMNETAATDYGAVDIGNNGTLSWASGSAANPYMKMSGDFNVWGDATLAIGTVATPIPRDSVATLWIDCAAREGFGLYIRDGGTFTAQGLSRTVGKNIVMCHLNTDEAVNQTTLGVDTDTGWLDNDVIVVASTTKTAAETESGALNGNAGASSLTVDGFGGAGGGLANAHGGTSPIAAEVALITRNVLITGASTLEFVFTIEANAVAVDLDWARIDYASQPQTSSNNAVDFDMDYCAMTRNYRYGFYSAGTTSGTFVLTNNIFWFNSTQNASNQAAFYFTSSNAISLNFSNNLIIGHQGSATAGSSYSVNIDVETWTNMTIQNNTIAGSRGSGLYLQDSDGIIDQSGWEVHSCAGYGVWTAVVFAAVIAQSYSNYTIWRNNTAGFYMSGAAAGFTNPAGFTFNNWLVFGNDTQNFYIIGDTTNGRRNLFYVIFQDCTIASDATYATTSGITLTNTYAGMAIDFFNCVFGGSAPYANHTNDIVLPSTGEGTYHTPGSWNLHFHNCTLGGTNDITNYNLQPGILDFRGGIYSNKHGQVAGAYKTWRKYGLITNDTVAGMFRTTTPSERLTPKNASNKLDSGRKRVAVADGATVTIHAYVRESVVGDGTDYNGARSRIILRKNVALGITADTVIDTATAAAEGAFEELTGTTGAASGDGVFEFMVDCDGTTGWVNVDDWSVA